MGRFTGFLGLLVILGAAWLFSNRKSAIKGRILAWGLGLQFAFALLVLKTDFGKIFQAISGGVNAAIGYVSDGSTFVFGPLGSATGPFGVVFAFQVLPIVIFIASFFSILSVIFDTSIGSDSALVCLVDAFGVWGCSGSLPI